MGVLVAIAIATSNLLLAVVVSLIVCFVLYVPQKVVALDDFFNLVVRGFADMVPILILLVIAFVLQKVTEGMGMTDFIISVAKPLLWGPVFPAIARAAMADGMDICVYCQSFGCNECIVNEWKSERSDEE